MGSIRGPQSWVNGYLLVVHDLRAPDDPLRVWGKMDFCHLFRLKRSTFRE